ncbi:peptidoglycan-binding domain-containing protein [Streptomyces sp. AD681]|uniref:peptidoglycan-binding domain-containing protein n=1 Tax=Streptomyces sp. AD681 TaxID=3019069 RepID=UPI0022F1D79C|nr:peptidoglycan-binding domain-containing protein [Streptomyces sp. AD681]MDA5142733.1 peptidoglycan-binding domain-containing protein [Streptomyces sp. AD681]
MDQQKEPSQDRSAGAACPECGTPRAADNTPSCACGTRASDALRDARTAQAAAAEDFDPLRIRPYVELDGAGKPSDTPDTSGPSDAPDTSGPSGSSGSSGEPSAAPASDSDPDATMTLRAVDSGAGTGAGAGAGTGAAAGTGTGAAARAGAGSPAGDAEATSALPTPLAPSTGSPSAHDLRLFDASATAPLPRVGPEAESADSGGRPPRRRRKGVLLSAAGAVVVVVGAAGFASGLFSYDTPSRDGALPDEVRASVPDPSTSEAPPSAGPSTTAASPTPSASASPSESASPSAEPSASASPSPSASSASPTPSRSAEPTQSTSAPAEEAPQESEEDDGDPGGGPTLRRGDQGPEVVELQQRLKEKWMYWGDLNGNYNRQVEDAVRQYQWESRIHTDEVGVYGPETRRRLESETREP